MSKAAEPMKDAADEVRKLRDFALDAPYSLKALADTFVKIKSTGIDPLNGSMKALVDGIAAFGGTESQLKRASLAIQEMSGKGVVQTKELRRQLGQDIPRAVEIMARALGVSVEQLSSIVEKGTLDAKTSLDAFFGEMERTFGGAAQRQMQTFNGLISRTHTLIQNLALESGDTGFFAETKKQLKDLNNFLSGNAAKVLAKSFGEAMQSVVQGIRAAIDWVIEFRAEITRVGEVVAIGFGVRIAISGLLNLASVVRNVTGSVRVFRLEWQALQTAWDFNKLNMLAGQLGIAGIGVTKMTGSVRMLSLAFTALGTAMAFASEILLPIIAVVIGVAYAFGLFEDKVNDAYEAVTKYGAVDEAQFALAEKRLKQEERALELARQRLALSHPVTLTGAEEGPQTTDDTESNQREVEIREKKLAEIKNNLAKARVQLDKKLRDDAVRDEQEAVEREGALRQREYDERMKDLAAAYAKEYVALTNQHRDVTKLQQDYQRNTREQALTYYQAQYDDLQHHIDEQKDLVEKGMKKADVGNAVVDDFTKKQLELLKQMQHLREQPIGPQVNVKAYDPAKEIQRAQEMLDKVNSQIEKNKASLAGANGELAQFIYMLEDGRNKNLKILGNKELDDLIEKLKAAKKEAGDLQDQVSGQTKFDREIQNIAEKARADLIEAQTRGKSALDKLAIMAKMGAFEGVKPITLMSRQYAEIDKNARMAANSMDTALGDTMQAKGRGMLGVIQSIANAWLGVKRNADGSANPNSPSAPPTSAAPSGSITPFATYQGGAYSGNLVRRESSGNPNATNGKAEGLGQFMESTWMDFLQKMHPEMLSAGREAALSSRRDPEMMQEAIAWYASQNAVKLAKAEVPVNDANLYLAHFLGPDGAIAALTKGANTALSAIPQLNAARMNNPGVFKDMLTVGDLQHWSQSFMGKGMTAPIMPGDSRMLDDLLKVASPQQAAIIKDVFKTVQETLIIKSNNALGDEIKKMGEEARRADESVSNLDKHVQEAKKNIIAGKYGPDVNPDSDKYTTLIENAEKADQRDKELADRAKLRRQVEAIDERKGAEEEALRGKEAEVARRLQTENQLRLSSDYLNKIKQLSAEDSKITQGRDQGIIDPNKADSLLKENADMKRRLLDVEVTDTVAKEQTKADAIKKSLMTQDEAGQYVFNQDVKRMQELLAMTSGNAQQRALIEQTLDEKIRLNRQKLLADSPIGKQFKGWADLGKNVETAFTGWIGGATDKLADFLVTGKANWADFSASILKDMAKMGLNSVIGGFGMQAKGMVRPNAAGTMPAPGGGAAKLAAGGTGKAAQHHAGGIVGAIAATRMVNPQLFARAQRFHNGGFPGLSSGEVPIIAKKGEIVGWPDQMAAAFGGGHSTQSNTFHIAVNGSAGTPAQNDDLVQKISVAMQDHVKQIAAGQIRQQMRPGGIMSGR
jgi:tape measure domain-containing protein